LLELLVSIPSSEYFWKFGTVLTELLSLLSHLGNFDFDISPSNISPLGHNVLDFGVKVVKLIQKLDLVLSIFQFWI
jgi:hypothetical protein